MDSATLDRAYRNTRFSDIASMILSARQRSSLSIDTECPKLDFGASNALRAIPVLAEQNDLFSQAVLEKFQDLDGDIAKDVAREARSSRDALNDMRVRGQLAKDFAGRLQAEAEAESGAVQQAEKLSEEELRDATNDKRAGILFNQKRAVTLAGGIAETSANRDRQRMIDRRLNVVEQKANGARNMYEDRFGSATKTKQLLARMCAMVGLGCEGNPQKLNVVKVDAALAEEDATLMKRMGGQTL